MGDHFLEEYFAKAKEKTTRTQKVFGEVEEVNRLKTWIKKWKKSMKMFSIVSIVFLVRNIVAKQLVPFLHKKILSV